VLTNETHFAVNVMYQRDENFFGSYFIENLGDDMTYVEPDNVCLRNVVVLWDGEGEFTNHVIERFHLTLRFSRLLFPIGNYQ
jgi:hypothetical protein